MSGDERASFRVDQLPPYLLGEIQQRVIAARSAGRDIVDLSHVNPDSAPAGSVVDKLVQAALLPHNHRYSSSQGIARLRSAIAEWYDRKYQQSLDPDREIVVTMGSKEGITHFLLGVLNPGENVLVPTPSYPIHASAIFLAGGSCIGVPLSIEDELPQELVAESEFFLRLGEVCRATWPRPRAMILSFPHNPTTITANRSFFERLVEFADEQDLLLVHDFAYADLGFESGSTPSLLTVPGARERSVEFFSLSKAYGLAGWRVGFCVGNEELVSALKRTKSYIDFGIFQPLQIATVEALQDREHLVDELREVYRSRRDVFVDGLSELGWDVPRPKATVFVWAKIPERFASLGSLGFAELLLDQAGVAACPGIGFDPSADSYVRFALMENEKRLRRALQGIGNLLR